MADFVPNTDTFSLTDVYDAVSSHANPNGDLDSCFENAEQTGFDADYNDDTYAPAMSMIRFRNYNFVVSTIDVDFSMQALKTENPTVLHSNYSTAPSTRIEYISLGVIYHPDWDVSSYDIHSGSGREILSFATNQAVSDVFLNFMNSSPYRSVWSDSDNDGTKDSLVSGSELTIGKTLTLSQTKTYLVAVLGDNKFVLKVDGETKVQNLTTNVNNFKYLHIFPITLSAGTHFISFTGIGDGSVNDSLGCIILDNTWSQLSTPVARSSWNVKFSSEQTIGGSTDIVTCPVDYAYNSSTSLCTRITSISNINAGDTAIITPDIAETATSWNIAFGDGASDSGSGNPPSTIEHVYSTAGTYNVVLSVTTSSGPGSKSISITVNP